jgi:hypothetical protein
MLFCFGQRIEFFTARTTWKLFFLDVFALRYMWVIFHFNLRPQEICNPYAMVDNWSCAGARIGMAFAVSLDNKVELSMKNGIEHERISR